MWGPATGLEVVTGSQGPTCSADAYALFAFRTCSSLRDAQAVISETVVDVCRIGATLLIRHFFGGGVTLPVFGEQEITLVSAALNLVSQAELTTPQVAPTAQEWATNTLARVPTAVIFL